MSTNAYEINEEQWDRIKNMFPQERTGKPGRPCKTTNKDVLYCRTEHLVMRCKSSGLMCLVGIPLVLMAQNSRGVPTYFGRPDLVNFLTKIHVSQIPWREYSVA